jgi:ubiquinone/menaquinone biosynthesis C-methylase UbiE
MDKAVELGQAIYSKRVLSLYDWWVLGISNTYIWQCPTELLEREFKKNASLNHLDVGVGTGYYLENCLSPDKRRLALLDLNPNSLESAATRVKQFQAETYQANVLEKIDLACDKFDSISINYLLHCMPGSLKQKAVLFENLIPYLNKGGVIFGSTILSQGAPKGLFARTLMAIYNKKGIFGNTGDRLEDLQQALEARFSHVAIRTEGCVAIFSAQL